MAPANSKKRNFLLLALIVAFGLFVRLAFFSGIDTSDGLFNTKYSFDISRGVFPTTQNHANSRIGLLIPVAMMYSAFGVNDYTSTALVLLTSLAGIVMIYFFGSLLFDDKIGLLSAFMLSFFPLDVIYSTKFLSDAPSSFFVALSIFLFLKAEISSRKSIPISLYAFSGLSLGIAFSIREMAALAILVFLAYALYQKRLKSGHFILMAGFMLVLSLEMLFFYAETGNPLYRFSSLSSFYVNALVQDNFYGRVHLLNFFLAWPYVIFANIQLGYFYAFIGLAAFYWIINRKKVTNYLVIWLLLIIIYFNYGTSSISRYAPFLAVARYLSIVTVPGILLLAAFLMEKNTIIRKVVLPFSLIFLFCVSLGSAYLDDFRNQLGTLKESYPFIKSLDKPVFTDSKSKLAIEYLSGYGNSVNLVDMESYTKSLNSLRDSYVVINNRMISNRMAAGEKLDFLKQIEKISGQWTKVKEFGNDPSKSVVIYYTG
ncbi:glycosyltransferase family 39 protein [Candidatus Woesearchaeota archaeon]|nr:glycosyltransferase family 39 protein [Candidatus Woesearchaeota archaeon]